MWHIILALFIIFCLVCGYLIYAAPHYITNQLPKKDKAVSIIIPARNEVHNLPKLLQRIHMQEYQDMEIVVANDGSTDETKEVAYQYNARVIDVPEGAWRGKSYACHIGAGYAQHDYLAFIDADTAFYDEYSLAKIIAEYERQHDRGVLSIQPFHWIEKQYETLSVIFNIVTVTGMNIFSKFKRHMHTDTVFGPFILTNREDYFNLDAHKAAKDSLIEGMGIHHAYETAGLPVTLCLGYRTLQFRMYPEGEGQLTSGWKKHIALGSSNTHSLIMVLIMLWMGGSIVTLGYLVGAAIWDTRTVLISLALYLVYGFQFKWISGRLIRLKWYHALIHPLYILFFFCVYGVSFIQMHVFKKVRWKGREINLKKK